MANNGEGNIPERDLWETPKELFDTLNNQYDFSFDCCASDSNFKVMTYTNEFLDINKNIISGVAWMNPPFSKAKIMFEHFFNVVDHGVAIYRSDNLETAIWQDIILKNATWIFFSKGRINYEGMNGTGSRFPSALIGYNVDVPKDLEGCNVTPEGKK